ncbi:MAG: 2-oxo-4-hydroxy-4-carboxy-5-ureidoimidazoline decarboxylase [Streptosporangiaceae bacterium]
MSGETRHPRPGSSGTPGLSALNDAEAAEAAATLRAVCAAESWVRTLVEARPYTSAGDLCAASDAAVARLDARGLAEALARHARIGEPADHERSRREQAGAVETGEGVRAALREANRRYEARFGHVFLIRASGRSAEEMLAALRARLDHDPATEREVAREELRTINRLRLEGLASE